MRVETEFVKFDDEDRGNIDYEGGEFPFGIHRAEKDHMFFLCYYTPEGQNNSLVPGKEKLSESSFSPEDRYCSIHILEFICNLLTAESTGKLHTSFSGSPLPKKVCPTQTINCQ